MAHHANVPMSYKMAPDQIREDLRARFPKGTSTLDLIKAGLRTATTRAASASPWKVGDTISFEGDPTIYRVTSRGLPEFNKDPEAWAKKEGWDPEAIRRDPKLLQQATKVGAVQTTFERVDKSDEPVKVKNTVGTDKPVKVSNLKRSTPPIKPVTEPTQTELNHLWANLAPTQSYGRLDEDLNFIKQTVDKLVERGKIRADAAPVVLSYAVYAHDEILGREKGESRSALKKFINENYFFDSGTRAPGTREEQAIVDFARGRENTKQEAIGKERGPLAEENREKLLKSMSGRSGRDFINATLDKAIESGAMPDDSGKRPERVEQILSVNPPEKPIKVSEGPLKRRPRQRSRIVVGPEGDDKETALKVGDKAFTRSSAGKPEEEKVKVLKRFPDGKVLVTKIDKAAELWDTSTVGGASTKWEGSEAETEWARSMGLDPESLKYGFDNNGKRYLAGSKSVDSTRTEKAKGALAFNLIKNKLFGEKKATEPDTGEPSVIMEDGKPVLYPPNSPLAGKPRTYPQRNPKQKARSKAKNEQQDLGRGPQDIIKAAVESQRPEPFSVKKERELIRQELLDESPELYEDEQQLKRRIKDKLNFVIRTKSGEALLGTPKRADVQQMQGRSKEPLKVSEEPTGKKFKVKGKAGLSPKILEEPTDLPEGRAAEREPQRMRVMRLSDIAPRTRLSDEQPTPPTRMKVAGDAQGLTSEQAFRKYKDEQKQRVKQARFRRANQGLLEKVRAGIKKRFKVRG